MHELWRRVGPSILIGFARLVIMGIVLMVCILIGRLVYTSGLRDETTRIQDAHQFARDCAALFATSDPDQEKALDQAIYQGATGINLSRVTMSYATRQCVGTAIAQAQAGKPTRP
jgi:hypothetical protein